MSDLSGPITHVEQALRPLWLIPLFALAGAAANAFLVPRIRASRRAAQTVAESGVVGALLLALDAAIQVHSPGPHTLSTFAWRMLRIGSLDVSFSLAMDPLSAAAAVIVTLAGVAACGAMVMAKGPVPHRRLATLNLFVFAMLLLVLADNLVVLLFGWEGIAVCSALLLALRDGDDRAASAGTTAFVMHRVGHWGVLAAMVVLFWGLGGSWLAHGGYHPDYRARFVAVEAEAAGDDDDEPEDRAKADHNKAKDDRSKGEAGAFKPKRDPGREREEEAERLRKMKQRAGAKGYLTMTTHPGARVYLGVSEAAQFSGRTPPELFAVSPFVRRELPIGVANIAVVPGGGAVVSGDGMEIALVEHVDIERGEEKVIVPIGPTVTFREIRDQFVVKQGASQPFVATALKERTLWGEGLLTIVCILLLVGAAAKSAQIPLLMRPREAGRASIADVVHATATAAAGVYLVARLDFLFAQGGVPHALIALVVLSAALDVVSWRRTPAGDAKTPGKAPGKTRGKRNAPKEPEAPLPATDRLTGEIAGAAFALARAAAWISDAIDAVLLNGAVDLVSRGVLAVRARLLRPPVR